MAEINEVSWIEVDGVDNRIKDAVAREEINNETTRATQAENTLNERINKEVEDIVDGDTIVGQAREVYSRQGKTVTDSFLTRTTAGSGTIGDGVATLKSVGGNIVKNLVNGTFASGWEAPFANTSFAVTNGLVTFSSKSADGKGRFRYKTPSGISGHIYYQKAYIKCSIAPNDNEVRFGVMNSVAIVYGPAVIYAKPTTEWQLLSVRYKTPDSSDYGEVNIYDTRKENQGEINAYKYLYIDLTEMFGAGKEPTKEECDRLFGTMDALPKGLTIANPTEFKSTGFNQFNPSFVKEGKSIVDNAIVDGDKKLAIIPCLPCKVGTGENNGYCVHGEFGEDIKVYLTPLNPMEVEGELYMHELTKDATTDTYVPQIKGYMLVEVPTTTNLCCHFLWGEDRDKHDYEPYHESKIKIPVIPQMSEQGLAGIQSTDTLVCDEIDFERGVYVKRIGCVDLGSLSWVYAESIKQFQAYLYLRALRGNNIIVDRYTAIPLDRSTGTNKTIFAHPSVGIIYINDDSFIDTTSLKESLQGVILYYELATPEEYPLPNFNNNYISSDYGVEQFDSTVPCNANNLYYMRRLAGETRNFLDRMYSNTDKTDAKEVADYITSGIEENKELATNAPNLTLRALYIAAGAEYNDTDQIIQKTAPWETEEKWRLEDDGTYTYWEETATVDHLPGHYYLNGLGDITEEQMLAIYDAGIIRHNSPAFYANNKNIRTFLPSKISGQEGYGGITLNGLLNTAGSVESVVFTNKYSMAERYGCAFTASNPYASFENCTNLKYIQKMSFSGMTKLTSVFRNCKSLISVKINKLKCDLSWADSSMISMGSVLYTIQNAAPTTAITITLHLDAYARIANQPDIIAALEAQPLITLVSA